MMFLALHYLPLDASFAKNIQWGSESHLFNLLLLICLIYCANTVDKNEKEIEKFTSFTANRGYLWSAISLWI